MRSVDAHLADDFIAGRLLLLLAFDDAFFLVLFQANISLAN